MTKVDFVRESATQATFDGRWMVWVSTRYFGVVRKSNDPLKRKEAWGYEAVSFGIYRNGMKCEAGFASRRAAADALVERVLSGSGGPITDKEKTT